MSKATIRDLIRRQTVLNPDAVALLAPNWEPMSYAGLDAAIQRCGESLAQHGLQPSDRVALVCNNGPGMALAFLAISCHAACAPLNPAYRAAEFEFYLSDLRPAAVVVEAGLDSPMRGVAEKLGIPLLEYAASAFRGPSVRPVAPTLAPTPDSVALLLHTSGTTSRPKLVPLTQANLTASAVQIAASLQLSSADRCLNVMPLFHIHGLGAAVLASLSAGAAIVCSPGFVAPQFFDLVNQFRPTWYTAVPTMHQSVLARAAEHREILNSKPFRFIRSCSAALAPALMQELESTFQVPVVEAYGMTEAAHQMASNPLPPERRIPGSVGKAAGPEVAIMDADGNLLSTGQPGEIVIRGKNVTAGYADNPGANAAAFTHGWFRTGDQGHLDERGYLFLSGRLKEIINRGGEKISPREIDEVFLAHPAVAQAVAFAVPHATLGESVAMAVVKRPNHDVSERQLREYAAERLTDFKVPDRVIFLDEIPKGPTGKIQRIGLASKLGIEAIEPVASQPAVYAAPRSEMQLTVARLFEKTLRVGRAGLHDNFFNLGGDSLLMNLLLTAVREETLREIPTLRFLDCPTIAGITRLVEHTEAPPSETLRVIIRGGKSDETLFCFPGSYGDVTGFFTLARLLDPKTAVVAFQLPKPEGRWASYRIEDLAQHYLAGMKEIQSDGVFHLAGSCTGGFIAYELARQLEAMGKTVGSVSLLDCYNHAWRNGDSRPSIWPYRARSLGKRVGHIAGNLRSRGVTQALSYLGSRFAAFLETNRQRAAEWAHSVILKSGGKLPKFLNSPRLAIRHAAARYVPLPWRGSLDLFRVEEPRADAYDYPDMGWAGLASQGVRVYSVPGSHLRMLSNPAVRVIAAHMQQSLREKSACLTRS